MKKCCIDDCEEKHLARGYCPKHYRRFSLYGDAKGGSEFRNGKAKNFFDMALIYGGDDCLLWPFAITSHGYASGGWGGQVHKVHRLVCEIAHGPTPSPDHEVAHNCGIRRCINPRHLRWATHTENMADTKRHGTAPSGERSGKAKLNWETVRSIRAAFASGLTQTEISDKFGVRFNTVHKVVHNQRWIE